MRGVSANSFLLSLIRRLPHRSLAAFNRCAHLGITRKTRVKVTGIAGSRERVRSRCLATVQVAAAGATVDRSGVRNKMLLRHLTRHCEIVQLMRKGVGKNFRFKWLYMSGFRDYSRGKNSGVAAGFQ